MNFLTIHPIYNTHLLFCHTTKKVLHFWVCCLHAFNRVLIRAYRKLNTWGRNSYPASCLWYFSKVLYGETSLYSSSKFTINISFIINRNKISSKVNKKNNLTIAIPFVTRPLSLLLNFLATSRKLGDKIRPYFNIFCLAYENQIYIYMYATLIVDVELFIGNWLNWNDKSYRKRTIKQHKSFQPIKCNN